MLEFMSMRCYEPKERLCGGEFGFVRHRFPIKDGISLKEVMHQELIKANRNILFETLAQKRVKFDV